LSGTGYMKCVNTWDIEKILRRWVEKDKYMRQDEYNYYGYM